MRNTFKEVREVLASAARTATTTATMECGSLGGVFIINVTASSLTPSVTFAIDGVGPGNTSWNILTSAAITGAGTTVLRIHPSLTAAANTVAKDILPSALKITATHADTDSITYSVGFVGVN